MNNINNLNNLSKSTKILMWVVGGFVVISIIIGGILAFDQSTNQNQETQFNSQENPF